LVEKKGWLAVAQQRSGWTGRVMRGSHTHTPRTSGVTPPHPRTLIYSRRLPLCVCVCLTRLWPERSLWHTIQIVFCYRTTTASHESRPHLLCFALYCTTEKKNSDLSYSFGHLITNIAEMIAIKTPRSIEVVGNQIHFYCYCW
jgi:hypothetical protein